MDTGVKIKINKLSGEVNIEGVGYEGMECSNDIDSIVNALGVTVENEELKDEHVKIIHTNSVKNT